MNTKLIKSFVATFAMGALSLGATAGFALPASAHVADIVAPTENVTGICGQSGTAVATIRPGEILKGNVIFSTGQGTVTVADTSGDYSQTFNGNGTTEGQAFVIMNTSNNINAVYSCKTDPSTAALLEVSGSQQQQQQQQQQQSAGTTGPIHINVENNITNDNSNHNDVSNKNILSNNHHNNHNNHNNHHHNHSHHHSHHHSH
ncbi:hypothetical protein [Dictyobacter halimunensis]|uniref:hypothetical protein n=1 Tax=Dictyobacter halimunensis TaxID=3026934 RepID=UPI0030C6F9FE